MYIYCQILTKEFKKCVTNDDLSNLNIYKKHIWYLTAALTLPDIWQNSHRTAIEQP